MVCPNLKIIRIFTKPQPVRTETDNLLFILYAKKRSIQNVPEARFRRRIPAQACRHLARAQKTPVRERRPELVHLVGQGHQHPVRRSGGRRRRGLPGHGRHPDRPEMVGLYGGHHGDESGQLSGLHPARRTVLHGIRPAAHRGMAESRSPFIFFF